MNDENITDKIERLNLVLGDKPSGQPVAMGAEFYEACASRGLVSTDIEPHGGSPAYLGTSPIILPPNFPPWEFQIGPPHA